MSAFQHTPELTMPKFLIRILLATYALLGLLPAGRTQIVPFSQLQAQADAAVAAGKDPIAGPRDCFWRRGPYSADPYLNLAYPDANTMYWGAVFTIPVGAKLRIEGQFPHARYASFISYDSAGVPVESVADYLWKAADGASNPFVPGADRVTVGRRYTLEVVDGLRPAGQVEGLYLAGQTREVIHAPKYGNQPGQQVILYRIYVGDKGLDETAGAGLPQVVLTTADGKEIGSQAACQALRTGQPLQLDPAALAIPMPQYQRLLDAAKKVDPTNPVYPATPIPTWHQQLDRDALYGIFEGRQPKADARRSEGGFYPNPDNQYIRAILSRKLGNVFMLRAKAPTTPRTFKGDSRMGDGELRYWSWCFNQGFANTRVNGCAFDEEFPLDSQGFYTLAVSRAQDRPRNARPECGIVWLPMADNGDGALDPDMTVLQLRHMLGTGDFKHAVQGIQSQGTMEQDMGPYFPRGRYFNTMAFETAFPCLLEKR